MSKDSKQPKQYEVKKGDTLWSLAREAGLTVDELRELNPHLPKDAAGLQIGTRISFPGLSASAPLPEAPPPTRKSPRKVEQTAPPKGITKEQWIKSVDPYWNRDLWKNVPSEKRVSVQEIADWAWGENGLRSVTKKHPHMEGFEDELLELMLNQFVAEGTASGKGRSTRNNPGNVGENDEGTKMVFDTPQAGMNSMANLIARRFVKPGTSPEALLEGYYWHSNPNKVYASMADESGRLGSGYGPFLKDIRKTSRGRFNYPVGDLYFGD